VSTSAINTTSNAGTSGARFSRLLPLLFGGTILSSACLLFLVQPLISKMILPWFGGSAAVWVTAMLFFQVCLLLGYLYAHFLTELLTPRMQVIVHLTLLVLSLALLPIYPSRHWLPQPGEDPTAAVFAVLGTCVGLPYTLLSATSPLIQKWFARRVAGSLPYRYFALSNAGSLLALFAFPAFVEPRFSSHQQSHLWSAAFFGFAVLCGVSAILQLRITPEGNGEIVRQSRAGFSSLLFWTALSACASALLLIVTNLLTQNIAPMPLLWVVPLGIYLLTFILCFESGIWYRRWFFLPLALPSFAYIASTTRTVEDNELVKIGPLLLASLFVTCMSCHGELARLKPEARQLTAFYLAIATGGAMGGLAIALLAPRFFNTNYEYPIVLSVTAFVLLIMAWRERRTWIHPRAHLAIWLAAAALCLLLSGFAVQQFGVNLLEAKLLVRNFYGTLRVDEFQDDLHRQVRQLNHGTITHGNQFLDARMRHVPTTYYGRESGIGLTWRVLEQAGPINMGVIGLGTGTLAAYGRAGDRVQFYDINPLVIDIARNRFFYLSESAAHIGVSLGDARLTMERQSPQRFDILVIDAFSGDAIPVHLLTEEAFRLYWKHLKPDGVLAVHVSNRYLSLAPIVKAAADRFGYEARVVNNEDDDSLGVFQSEYVLVSRRANFFSNPLLVGEAMPVKVPSGTHLWTDDYSNIWQAIHFKG
jgi:SAM-dependent methyltransferase